MFNRGRSSGSIYVDEDALGEIQLLPARNRAWCRREIAKINEFARDHSSPDGLGWTEMYFRGSPEFPLVGQELDFKTTCAALWRKLPAIGLAKPDPYTDWSERARALAFGAPSAAIIVADYGAGYVEAIDFQFAEAGHDARTVLAAAAAIRSPEPLLLVDWLELNFYPLV